MPASKKYLCRAPVKRNGKEWACPYKARKDGYCKHHHPDEVERRRVEREAIKEGIGKCQKN